MGDTFFVLKIRLFKQAGFASEERILWRTNSQAKWHCSQAENPAQTFGCFQPAESNIAEALLIRGECFHH